ncbi:MAG: hypothetical protein ABI678_10265 [Kofleriaceae bacterium]
MLLEERELVAEREDDLLTRARVGKQDQPRVDLAGLQRVVDLERLAGGTRGSFTPWIKSSGALIRST